MAFSATILGSGSSGNATLLSHGDAHVLLDAGLSGREICRRMLALRVAPEKLHGVVITHEHMDHTRGLRALARQLRLPVYVSEATLESMDFGKELCRCERIESGQQFELAGMTFLPFAVPHDAADPLAFVVNAVGQRLGLAMDLGYVSGLVKERLTACDCLILESNHDLEMLKVGPYPWALKQRVMSRQGHLSNEAVAQFLAEDFDLQARFIYLAHLSKNNNHPDLAMLAASRALASRRLSPEDVAARLRMSHQERSSQTAYLD
jgi:phosphoribosyl 1,2-cyclic phosphodiesterase